MLILCVLQYQFLIFGINDFEFDREYDLDERDPFESVFVYWQKIILLDANCGLVLVADHVVADCDALYESLDW